MDSLNNHIDDLKMNRMLRGERKHGPLDLDRDPRNFIEEALEELIDCLNYLEIAMLQGKLPFCRWVNIDIDVRLIIWRLREENRPGTGEKGV